MHIPEPCITCYTDQQHMHSSGQDLELSWSESKLQEIKRYLEDAIFKKEYVALGCLQLDTVASEAVFNDYCDHHGLVRSGGKGKTAVQSLS